MVLTAPRIETMIFPLLLLLFLPSLSIHAATTTTTTHDHNDECKLYLGPSLIKSAASHGFGLGVFVGGSAPLPANTTMSSELIVSVYDQNFHLDETHPPLREYLWLPNPIDDHGPILESKRGMLQFVPGLASIAPCTSVGYNLALTPKVTYDEHGVERDRHPWAGAVSYRSSSMFTTVREIQPGEELVVECDDDDFDASEFSEEAVRLYAASSQREGVGGGSAGLTTGPESRICLDDGLVEGISNINGRGAFASKAVKSDTVLTSTPMVPLHRDELRMKPRNGFNNDDDDGDDEEEEEEEEDYQNQRKRRRIESNPTTGFDDPNTQWQLLTNYCYGHPDSVLLWLPHGPSVNAINHSPTPNARIQWHILPSSNNNDHHRLSPRQQSHHPDLLQTPPEKVAYSHGRTLIMDVVAIRNIEEGEEVTIDYGPDWRAAWDEHVRRWPNNNNNNGSSSSSLSYQSAATFNQQHEQTPLRTFAEQQRDPYPPNIQTACYFEKDWIDLENGEEPDIRTIASWNDHTSHRDCLLPCVILDRVEQPPTSSSSSSSSERTPRYMVELTDTHPQNPMIDWECHLYEYLEYFYTDVPREGIVFIDRPYSSDTWLPHAFRRPIGLEEGMVPDIWRRKKKLRGGSSRQRTRGDGSSSSRSGLGGGGEWDVFKRRTPITTQETLDAIRVKADWRSVDL